jgi:phosphohistidine phosphatase SixA
MIRRSLLSIVFALLLVSQSTLADAASTSSATWAALKQGGHIVMFRHANAPGNGDPGKVTIGDCNTQRNLDAAGREQSTQIGERFRQQGIAVDQVWSSQWCRTRDTATLAFGVAKVKDEPAFNSFFANPGVSVQQSEQAKRLLLAWLGTNNLVVVTHQVNVTQLTGVYPASGEGVVLKRDGKALRVVGRITP